ncbi:KilA-N domain-containing protein [Klebsiella aerogenes]|uniref:KilA-N domain-containing protein n=1 Tax=Klebsiella aerogenes TaxID=548 RepID=UPI0035172BF1|nr:KilA-N domain-containing protein [Klebsiella aerogenes]
MSQKTISICFNGKVTKHTSDMFGRFNLNRIHEASETNASKRPGSWLRGARAKELIRLNTTAQICALEVINGGDNRGSYAVEPVLYAYAEWISADFHQAVVTAFTALVNNDVKKAKEIVRTAVRVEGIPVRKEVASKIMKYGDKTFIGDMTDAVNLYVTGKTAKGIRATRTEGFNKSTPTRDRMTDNELKAVTAIEALVALQIERDENKPDWMGRSSVRELINNTGHTVRSMIQ